MPRRATPTQPPRVSGTAQQAMGLPSGSGPADLRQHLVAQCGQGGCIPGLGVQSQQRLGVGRPDVEPPVVVADREPVEVVDIDAAASHLVAHGGQMAATARALGLERSHLYKKAKALGLRGDKDPEDEKS